MPSLVWFRQDLRLADNPALHAAAAAGPVVGLYVLDDVTPGDWALGGASRWWLNHSLQRLSDELAAKGGVLVLRRGRAADVVPAVASEMNATGVFWNRCYEPYARTRDEHLKTRLKAEGRTAQSFNGTLLFEPWDVATKTGGPYTVFTPFWKACVAKGGIGPVLPAPATLTAPAKVPASDTLADWGLLPTRPNWSKGFDVWTPGEAGARQRLEAFLAHGLNGYKELRNRPDLPNVSRLSPHLHWGEISPRQVWHAAERAREMGAPEPDVAHFLSELGWREFSYHLLYYSPHLPDRNWKPNFNAFPWASNPGFLKAWQQGQTGYPIVDAGLRELWATGWMHNRVRMIVASFLIKDLLIHWKEGEAWFWDTLVDADLASNAASWQWVAGSGADAAPFFRIFNPVGQGEKFDPEGAYVRRWVPELAKLPTAFLHAPWTADKTTLLNAGVILGTTYPRPIVDHAEARNVALAAFEKIKLPAVYSV
jgi:deoxyribodipyrimidine photo-lyase